MHPFRKAVEAGDWPAVEALLSDDVVFSSPVVYKPYHGKAVTVSILKTVSEVFNNFRYIRELATPDETQHALVFQATVDGKELTGCDFIRRNTEGLIDEFTVMVRPLSGANALAAEMGKRLEQALEAGGQ